MMCVCGRFVGGISNILSINLARAKINFMKSKTNCCIDKVGLRGAHTKISVFLLSCV